MKTLSNLQEDACNIVGLIDAMDVLLNNSEERRAMNGIHPVIAQARALSDALHSDLDIVNADKLDLSDSIRQQQKNAAQDRGEVATKSDQNLLPEEKKVSAADLGLRRDAIDQIYRLQSLLRTLSQAVDGEQIAGTSVTLIGGGAVIDMAVEMAGDIAASLELLETGKVRCTGCRGNQCQGAEG